MAFKALPKFQPGRSCSDDVTVAVHVKGATAQAAISIPAHVLREAGLDGEIGKHIHLLVGDGSDFGSVALVPGDGLAMTVLGKSTQRVVIRSSRICDPIKYEARVCEYEAGRIQLIIHFPADFPWNSRLLLQQGLGVEANTSQRVNAGLNNAIGAAA